MQTGTKRKVMKEVVEEINVKVICDHCEKEIKSEPFDVYNPFLEIRFGESYPEGASGTMFETELCEECVYKAVRLLQKNNFKIREKEWDW